PVSSATSAEPGTSEAPHTSSAKPVPPAAPAPAVSARSARPSTSARRARPASARSIVSPSSPFCGPNTAAAPLGPESGFVTSLSTVTPPAGSGARRDRSAEASSSRPAAPSTTDAPKSLRNRAPSAVSSPMPPSVEALEPMPSTRRETPASSAALMACPKPSVDASSGRRSSPSSSMPDVFASSTTPVPPGSSSVAGSRSHDEFTGAPAGPVTRTGTRFASGIAFSNASTVPSPPSAMGRSVKVSAGDERTQPSAIATAASAAVTDPLKLSGAMTIVRGSVMGPSCRMRSRSRQRHLDDLGARHVARERVVELVGRRGPAEAPSVGRRERGEVDRLGRELHAPHGRGIRDARDLEPLEDRTAALVADDDLHAGTLLPGGQQEGPGVVQEREVADEHARDAARRERDARRGRDRAVDAREAAVRVHAHGPRLEHVVGDAHEAAGSEHEP